RLGLLYNVGGGLGNPSPDAALTSPEWDGRVLGESQQPRTPPLAPWDAAGNKVALLSDPPPRPRPVPPASPRERPGGGVRVPLPGPACLGAGESRPAAGGRADDLVRLLPGRAAGHGPNAVGQLRGLDGAGAVGRRLGRPARPGVDPASAGRGIGH